MGREGGCGGSTPTPARQRTHRSRNYLTKNEPSQLTYKKAHPPFPPHYTMVNVTVSNLCCQKLQTSPVAIQVKRKNSRQRTL